MSDNLRICHRCGRTLHEWVADSVVVGEYAYHGECYDRIQNPVQPKAAVQMLQESLPDPKPIPPVLKYRFRPRNEGVVVRREVVESVRGIAMPQGSAGGVRYVVVAVGPKVEDLKVDDEVRIAGQVGVDIAPIHPSAPDLYIVPNEKSVLLVMEPYTNGGDAYEEATADH